jgi:putative transcriptional regulator
MAVQYNRLFKKLIDLKKSPSQFSSEAGISANIMGRLKRDEYISLESLEKICTSLDCGLDDVVEFINNDNEVVER